VLIDWFTVGAQIVNFLVLIALLKYFLYGRIINAMNEREKKIASRLEEAEQKKREAEQEGEAYRTKNQELDAMGERIVAQVREEAETHRRELMQKARDEVGRIQASWHDALKREKNSFLQELRQRANAHVYTIARRALKDLADSDLEQQVITMFLKHIQELPEKEREEIAASIKKTDETVIVHSAFEIPVDKQQIITKIIKSTLQEGIDIQYQTVSEMILGIELKVYGHKIAWSLDSYLELLETSVTDALESETKKSIAISKEREEPR